MHPLTMKSQLTNFIQLQHKYCLILEDCSIISTRDTISLEQSEEMVTVSSSKIQNIGVLSLL
ncbi:hypothetical protein D3C86_1363660 [compost metagenome]